MTNNLKNKKRKAKKINTRAEKPKRARLKDIEDDGRIIVATDDLPVNNPVESIFAPTSMSNRINPKRKKRSDLHEENIKLERGDIFAMYWASIQVILPIILVYVGVFTLVLLLFLWAVN